MTTTVHSCTRRLHFSAGHRVYGHESKCAHLHGHNYIVFITAQASLDSLGRVVDFGVLKEKIDPWIQDYWDHGMILWEKDPLGAEFRRGSPADPFSRGGLVGQKHYLLPTNPTAENLAAFLLKTGQALLHSSAVVLTRVRVWETPNCFADACLDLPVSPLDVRIT